MKKEQLKKIIREEFHNILLEDKSINNKVLGIDYTIILTITSSGGYIKYLPKTSKDLDLLNNDVSKRKNDIKLIESILTKQLKFKVSYIDNGSSGLNFIFSLSDLENFLITKLK